MSPKSPQSTQRSMDGYIRVSRVMGREGESYISPTVQREAIERWAEYKGLTINAWHVDEDQTGGDTDRPGLEAAIGRVVSGESGGIVSWKIDRFSRNTEDGLRGLRELEAHNARLVFVSEDIDTSGVMGKFVYTIMLAMATYFLDNVKASWIEAKTRAQARGAKIGPTSLGYRRNTDGTLRVHEPEAAIVREAFDRAARFGLNAAVEYLQELGLTHESGKRAGRSRAFTTATVRRLLATRVYLGEIRWGDLPPVYDESLRLVTRATWEAAQPGVARGRSKARHYPLSGLARCGTCGEEMIGGSAGKNQRTYRCRATLVSWKGKRCEAGVNVTAERLEDHVRDALRAGFSGRVGIQSVESTDLAGLEAAMLEAERELDDFLADTTGAAALRKVGRYDAALTARVDAVEDARDAYRTGASLSARALSATPDELLASDDPDALRELVASAFYGLVVAKGRGPLEGRVSFIHEAPVSAVAAA